MKSNKASTHNLNNSIVFFQIISIIINIAAVVLTLSAEFILKNEQIQLSVAVIMCQFVITMVDLGCQRKIESKVFKTTSKKEAINIANAEKRNTEIQYARAELRKGLNILMSVSVVISLILIISSGKLLIGISCICILCIGYIYADYIPHSKAYAKKYDKLHLGKDNSIRANKGLAKIYYEEYEETGFDRGCDKYKEWAKMKGCSEDTNKIAGSKLNDESDQDSCIKFILRSGLDEIISTSIGYSIIITAINIIFTFPGTMEFVSTDLSRHIPFDFNIVVSFLKLVLNIIFFTMSLYSIFTYSSQCEKIKELVDFINSNDAKKRLEKYTEEYESNSKICARGKFDFCTTIMDKGISLDKINIQYRMLFTHRLDANVPRFNLTSILIAAALLCLLMEFFVPWKAIGVIFIIYFILTIIFRLFILEKIGKRQIIEEIKKLKFEKELILMQKE